MKRAQTRVTLMRTSVMSDTNGCWRGCGALAWRSWSSVSVLSQVSPTAGKLLVGLSWGARRCPLCGILYFVVLMCGIQCSCVVCVACSLCGILLLRLHGVLYGVLRSGSPWCIQCSFCPVACWMKREFSLRLPFPHSNHLCTHSISPTAIVRTPSSRLRTPAARERERKAERERESVCVCERERETSLRNSVHNGESRARSGDRRTPAPSPWSALRRITHIPHGALPVRPSRRRRRRRRRRRKVYSKLSQRSERWTPRATALPRCRRRDPPY